MEPVPSPNNLFDGHLVPTFANMRLANAQPSYHEETELPAKLPELVLCQTSRDDGMPETYPRLKALSKSFCDKQRKIQSIPLAEATLFTSRDAEKPNRVFLALSKSFQLPGQAPLELHRRKANLYHLSLDKLHSEKQLVDLLEEYLQTCAESSQVTQQSYSLESTESLAFFLRFKQILDFLFSGKKNSRGLTSVYPTAKKLLEASRRYVSKDPSLELQRLEVRLLTTQIAIGQILVDMETSLGLGDLIISLMRSVTPLFAYLSCVCEDRFSFVKYTPGHFVSSQARNIEWAKGLQEVFKQSQKSYFVQQIAFYEEASRGLSLCLQNDPKLKEKPFNFHHYIDKVTPIQPPAEYRAQIENFLQRFYPSSPSQEAQPTRYTQEQIDAFLLAENGEEQKKLTGKKKANHNKPPSKKSQPAKPPSDALVSREQPIAVAEKKTAECSVSPILQNLLKASSLSHQRRVSRWLKLDQSKLSEVYTFVDYKNGVAIQQYAGLTLEQLQEQFLMHAFSVHVDKLVTASELRDKYCLQTESGYSMIVEVVRQGKPKLRGIACYALDKRGHVYHRKIEKRLINEFFAAPLAELAKARSVDLHDSQEDALQNEIAQGFEGDSFEVHPETEVVRFYDCKNSCYINVFPLK